MRRRVELVWMPVMVGAVTPTVDLPDNAAIVQIDFHDLGGLGHQRTPSGVWVAVTVERYDDDTQRTVIRDELPPPELP